MQGGSLKIESAEGVGTSVYVTLPRRAKTTAPDAEIEIKRARLKIPVELLR